MIIHYFLIEPPPTLTKLTYPLFLWLNQNCNLDGIYGDVVVPLQFLYGLHDHLHLLVLCLLLIQK